MTARGGRKIECQNMIDSLSSPVTFANSTSHAKAQNKSCLVTVLEVYTEQKKYALISF